ncbi:MAG TPA: EamA family transporter [Gaiella sp.]|nr:EamA family transporter [Gaiella sp.]
MTPKAWTALWAVYLIWGSTYLGIKVAGDTIPSFFAVSTRFLIAGGIMATLVAVRRGAGALRVTRRELACSALIGLLLPGANGILFVAERTVPTGLASLIIASVPLLVVLMRVGGGERPPPLAIVGVLVGFVGVAILFHPEGGATWWGIGLAGVSAFAWALGSYLSARIPLPEDALVATTFEMLAGGLLLLPVGLVEHPHPETFSGGSLLAFAYLVVFGSVVGYTAYVWLLHHVPLGTVSTYAYVNPVVAIGLGVLFLHEDVSSRIALGAAIVLGSVAIVVRQESEVAVEPFAE